MPGGGRGAEAGVSPGAGTVGVRRRADLSDERRER
jgi:hypothetical protein